MRVSADSHSWRAGGVLRRDFRSARGEPEVPRARKAAAARRARPSSTCSAGGVHDVERVVTITQEKPWGDEGHQKVMERTEWGWRCTKCGTSEISTHLLGPAADLIGTARRSALLAATWCQEGHLIVSEAHDGWRTWYGRSRGEWVERWCVMCGRSSGSTHEIRDERLWARVPGVTEYVIRRISTGHTARGEWRAVPYRGPSRELGPKAAAREARRATKEAARTA